MRSEWRRIGTHFISYLWFVSSSIWLTGMWTVLEDVFNELTPSSAADQRLACLICTTVQVRFHGKSECIWNPIQIKHSNVNECTFLEHNPQRFKTEPWFLLSSAACICIAVAIMSRRLVLVTMTTNVQFESCLSCTLTHTNWEVSDQWKCRP